MNCKNKRAAMLRLGDMKDHEANELVTAQVDSINLCGQWGNEDHVRKAGERLSY